MEIATLMLYNERGMEDFEKIVKLIEEQEYRLQPLLTDERTGKVVGYRIIKGD